jgi:hypothetical protein
MKTITVELTKKQVKALKPLLDKADSCEEDQFGIILGQAGRRFDGSHCAKFGFMPHKPATKIMKIVQGIDA